MAIDKLLNGGFVFKKRFGQNFITDKNLLSAIALDANIKDCNVLEIGTGGGTLTKELAALAKKVVTLEIDETLKPFLQEEFLKIENIELKFCDVLKLSENEIEKFFNGEQFKIVANLPYYITTPIIFKFIEEKHNLSEIYIMVQKEVAQRLSADAGTVDYGAITAKIGAVADVRIIREVSRKNFIPPPNVDSCVVQIKFTDKKLCILNDKHFQRVINAAFQNRRKMYVSNLSAEFCLSKDKITKMFSELNLSPLLRGEVLSYEHFAKISNYITKLLKTKV